MDKSRGFCRNALLASALALSWAVQGWAADSSEQAALAAGNQVTVAGVTLALDTEIWVGAEAPAGAPVPAIVVLRVIAAGAAVPRGLRVDGLWYVNGGAVSPGAFVADTLSVPEGEIFREAGEVVDLDGDGVVDVVIGITEPGGRRHMLKASGQTLRRL